jgi:hypothetical protein
MLNKIILQMRATENTWHHIEQSKKKKNDKSTNPWMQQPQE